MLFRDFHSINDLLQSAKLTTLVWVRRAVIVGWVTLACLVIGYYYVPTAGLICRFEVVSLCFLFHLLITTFYCLALDTHLLRIKTQNAVLTNLAKFDSLTNTLNRAYVKSAAGQVLSFGTPMGILSIDINQLKLVNDIFGHHNGDKYILLCVDLINSVVRETDRLVRVGGDEFVLFVADVDQKNLTRLIARLSEKFKEFESSGADAYIWKIFQPSVAIGSAVVTSKADFDIVESLVVADEDMYQHKLQYEGVEQNSLLVSLTRVLEVKDLHSNPNIPFNRMIFEIGKCMRLSDEELFHLNLLASYHDIGKIAMPDRVLLSSKKLNAHEWRIMQTHSVLGYRIAKHIDRLTNVAESILHHHENWDGSGYPDGLREKEIGIKSRIIRVVDTYAAIRTRRPYKDAGTHKFAINELIKGRGIQYDPQIVDLFLQLYFDERQVIETCKRYSSTRIENLKHFKR